MIAKKLLAGLCWLLLASNPAWAQDWLPPGEMNLPPGVLNVARTEFTNHIGGGDYGLANDVPVEVREDAAPEQRIRIVRTPRPMRLSNQNRATFQVLLGTSTLSGSGWRRPRSMASGGSVSRRPMRINTRNRFSVLCYNQTLSNIAMYRLTPCSIFASLLLSRRLN